MSGRASWPLFFALCGRLVGGTISADYFGKFSRYLANKLNAPDHFVAMMSNGTSGEINIWDFLNPGRFRTANLKKSALIGEALAEKVLLSLGNLQWQTDSTLMANQLDPPINIRKPLPSDLAAARQLTSTIHFEELDKINLESIKYLNAREQVLLHELPDTTLFPIQGLK